MFEKGDYLILSDDNEYVVADLYNEGIKIYVYLVDINNNQNVMFARLENDEIVELSDKEELDKVVRTIYDRVYID